LLLLHQVIVSHSSDCGDTKEGSDYIPLFMYTNATTNVQLRFPDVIFSPFWDNSMKQNNVCISDTSSPALAPSFSTDVVQQAFTYTCTLVNSEQLADWFQQSLFLNLGNPAACNCTIMPGDTNQTLGINGTYISSFNITITGTYTNSWLDYYWIVMGCSISMNYSTTPLRDGDIFQQVIVAQSYYTPNAFAISFWLVLGFMMGGAALVVAIALIVVSRTGDDEYFFNRIKRK